MKTWQAMLLGTWLGVAICIPLIRHVTIPAMSWYDSFRFCTYGGLGMTPAVLLMAWLAENANRRTRGGGEATNVTRTR